MAVRETGRLSSVRMSIYRGDASDGEMVTYDVPVREGMVVLDAVLWVQANLAPDLAVRWNCKAAKCGSCSAEINGFPRLMCKSPVSDYGDELSVRPMRTFPVIRDLVTERTPDGMAVRAVENEPIPYELTEVISQSFKRYTPEEV